MRVQVKDFMSSPVTTVVEKNTVREVRVIMKRQGIHAVPVISYSKQFPDYRVTIQGIVTATDLNREMDGNTSVEEIMTPNVHIIHQDSSAKAAAKMMLKHKVHHLIVMDNGKISGMISSLDFVKLVAKDFLD